MKPVFTHRNLVPEIMDDLDMRGEILTQTLDQLEVINTWLGGYAIVKEGIQHFISTYKLKTTNSTLNIADVGCGGGDTARMLAKYLRKQQIPFRLYGFDANPYIINYAREHSGNFPEIQYEVMDMFSPTFHSQSFDITLFNLILHHFDDAVLRTYLPLVCQQSKYGVLINDLQRHWLPFRLFQLITWLFCANHMTRHDGLLSIQKGFTLIEWDKLLQNVLPYPYRIQWRWAFRHQILIETHE